MTTIQHSVQTRRSSPRRFRADRVRRRLAIGAVVATLPYSVLKIAWLAGAPVGLSDPSFGTSPTMQVGNALTLALDLVALALALVVYTGVRAPRWFVLPTMWVGYGLLGQILMMIGPSLVVQLLSDPAPDAPETSPIAGWVYAVVYTGFSGLGLCLLPAFAIYAWQRWGNENGWGERLSGIRADLPTTPALAATVVTVASAARAVWSGSGTEATGWSADALVGLVVAATLLAATHGFPGRLPRAVPLVVIWTASGAWTAWGCYDLVIGTLPNELMDSTIPAVDAVLCLARIAAGILLLRAVRSLSAAADKS